MLLGNTAIRGLNIKESLDVPEMGSGPNEGYTYLL
jgi:hypothetical protein